MRCTLAGLVGVLGCGPSAGSDDGGGTTGRGETGNTGTQTTVTVTVTSASTSVAATSGAPGTTTSEGAGESASDDETETSDGADTMAFIQDPDGGCTNSTCDVWAQDCPRGDKCVPWAANGDGLPGSCAGARCSEIDPDPKPPGDPCTAEGPWTGFDDCEIGAYCWNVDERTHEGVCVAQCIGSQARPACGDAALSCFELDGTSVTACVPACDPLAPSCAVGSTCAASAGHDQGTLCLSQDLEIPTGLGSACAADLGCGDGFACVEGSMLDMCATDWCCATLCDLAAPSCALENPDCTQLPNAPDGVGACVAA